MSVQVVSYDWQANPATKTGQTYTLIMDVTHLGVQERWIAEEIDLKTLYSICEEYGIEAYV